jgi:hypothetical protein
VRDDVVDDTGLGVEFVGSIRGFVIEREAVGELHLVSVGIW